jgi:hypothetical protein
MSNALLFSFFAIAIIADGIYASSSAHNKYNAESNLTTQRKLAQQLVEIVTGSSASSDWSNMKVELHDGRFLTLREFASDKQVMWKGMLVKAKYGHLLPEFGQVRESGRKSMPRNEFQDLNLKLTTKLLSKLLLIKKTAVDFDKVKAANEHSQGDDSELGGVDWHRSEMYFDHLRALLTTLYLEEASTVLTDLRPLLSGMELASLGNAVTECNSNDGEREQRMCVHGFIIATNYETFSRQYARFEPSLVTESSNVEQNMSGLLVRVCKAIRRLAQLLS